MQNSIEERLQELYRRAEKERDVEKILEIMDEIQRLQAEKKKHLKQSDPSSETS